MCTEHHNHRTGNCAECRVVEAAQPPMPQLWQDAGDQA